MFQDVLCTLWQHRERPWLGALCHTELKAFLAFQQVTFMLPVEEGTVSRVEERVDLYHPEPLASCKPMFVKGI